MAFTDTMIDTPRRRPSLSDALMAQHSTSGSGRGISIRGVGNSFAADVPDDDPYAENLDVQSTQPGMSRGQAASSFLSGRLNEIAGNYDQNMTDEATKVQRIKNAIQLEAQLGQAAIHNNPTIRRMQDEQFQRQYAMKQLDLQGKVLPEQIRAGAQRDVAQTTAAGREASSASSARIRALERNLENLEKLRYSPGAPSPTVDQPGSFPYGALGMGSAGGKAPNPEYTGLSSRIDSLRRMIDNDADLSREPDADGDDLGAVLDAIRRRYAQP